MTNTEQQIAEDGQEISLNDIIVLVRASRIT